MLHLLAVTVISYLLGSISPSIILSRLIKGVDIRTYGSGNAGMTNAIRLLGGKWGTVVALFDFAKGFCAAMVIGSWLMPPPELLVIDPIAVRILAGIAAVAGHIWTVFFGFKGGKGVLTVAGAVTGVAPSEVGMCFVVFMIIFLLTRYVSLGSIIGAIFFPVIVFIEAWALHEPVSPYLLVFSVFVAVLIMFTHRANIRRLLKGEENKFGSKKQS
ncbi:glycerol-3-phosphate 1-O-acyltransferase PlsY [bacterium]|nr:glycerol-3-phosphate 1-O-acyltransferase PlsY [bacterium]